MISIEVSQNINKLLEMDNRLTFAIAKSLTQVAREAQIEVMKEIRKDFTIRTTWYLPTNRYGIHATTATVKPMNLSVTLSSAADWLAAQELGETHVPTGGRVDLAVPLYAVRPTGTEVIRAPDKPRGSRMRRAFILTARDGRKYLVRRVGPRPQDIQFVYALEKSTKRKKTTPMTTAVIETFKKSFAARLAENFLGAIKSARAA